MRLVCPACGAVASLEAWINDPAIRQFVTVLVKLHPLVQQVAIPYLGLFRKGERGLAWSRALRLLEGLEQLVDPGSVQWDREERRPSPPELWAECMKIVIDSGKREFQDHNYLKKIVWDRARPLAASAEKRKDDAARNRGNDPGPKRTEEDMVSIKDMMDRFHKDPRAFALESEQE